MKVRVNQIRAARALLGWSQKDLAERSDISEVSIVNLEKEKAVPHQSTVDKILNAFELAGELADGAISWLCPPRYLQDVALPAMRRGAEKAERPVPPLVAHVLVAPSVDMTQVRASTRSIDDSA